jgi:chemotaxis protein histidine kinase CheA
MTDLPPDNQFAQPQGMELARANLRALLEQKKDTPPLAEAEGQSTEEVEAILAAEAELEPEVEAEAAESELESASDEVDKQDNSKGESEAQADSLTESKAPDEAEGEESAGELQDSESLDDDSDPAEETAPMVYRYRLAASLPTDLEGRLNAARQHIGLEAIPMGWFAWLPDFYSDDIEAVLGLLREWAADHLPLMVEVERVEALVEGAQRYIAAYALEPASRITAAHMTLQHSLQAQLETLPQEGELPFGARLLLADHVRSGNFPPLLQFMQTHFAPLDWPIESLELLQTPDDDLRWEVREVIAPS